MGLMVEPERRSRCARRNPNHRVVRRGKPGSNSRFSAAKMISQGRERRYSRPDKRRSKRGLDPEAIGRKQGWDGERPMLPREIYQGEPVPGGLGRS